MPADESSFGSLLRRWRRSRGLSQLELSLRSGVSLRHVGFVETGRSAPSRDMVLRLSSVLDVPSREVNLLLAAAGFAPAYGDTPIDGPAMDTVRGALELAMRKQMPYPAWVLDAAWVPLLMNDAQKKLLGLVRAELGGRLPEDLLFHPDGLRRCVANWEELAAMAVRRLRREIALGYRRFVPLLERCLAYPGVPDPWRDEGPGEAARPVLPVLFELGPHRLHFVTTLATLGTAVDATGQELRIESYYPLDDVTDAFCRDHLA